MEPTRTSPYGNGSLSGAIAGCTAGKQAKSRETPSPSASTYDSDRSPITSPPYWIQSHQRSSSNISVDSLNPGTITLQDNTDGDDDKNEACWARSVHIDDHVVINGSRTGIGAFVVWNITVETLSVSVFQKIYSVYSVVTEIGWINAHTKKVFRI